MRTEENLTRFVLHVVLASLVVVLGVVVATWPLVLAQPEPQAFLTAMLGTALVVLGGRRINRLLGS